MDPAARSFSIRDRKNQDQQRRESLAALVLPASILGGYFLTEYSLFFVSAILAAIAAPMLAYFIWMFKDPNRLQSEDYQLAHQKMLLGDDRHPGKILDGRALVPNDPQLRVGSEQT